MGKFSAKLVLFAFAFLTSLVSAELSKTEEDRLQSLPGHLKPFGSTGPFFEIHSIDGFPTTSQFFNGFVAASLPLIMKGAATISPAYTKWTNEYLQEKSANDKKVVFVEGRKKEIRTGSTFNMTFNEFVETYQERDMYWVNEVPPYLREDIIFPPPLQCEEIMENNLVTNVMWFSSGGTKSVVHSDGVENINCLYRGNKTLIFVSPFDTDEDWIENVIDRSEGGYSGLDVDAVDFIQYPSLAKMRYGIVKMQPGDCLYIPFNWVHQVNSFGDNLAVNIWFNHKPLDYVDLTPEKCGDHSDITMDQVTFTSSETYGNDQLMEELEGDLDANEEAPSPPAEPKSPIAQFVADIRAGLVFDRKEFKNFLAQDPEPAWNSECQQTVDDAFKILDLNMDNNIDKKDFIILAKSKETTVKATLLLIKKKMDVLPTRIFRAQLQNDKEVMRLVIRKGDVLLPYAKIVYGKYYEQLITPYSRSEL